MVIDVLNGPVASWKFYNNKNKSVIDNREKLELVLKLYQQAAMILEEYQLLYPFSLDYGKFIYHIPPNYVQEVMNFRYENTSDFNSYTDSIHKAGIPLYLDKKKGAATLFERSQSSLDYIEKKKLILCPSHIIIRGTGIIFDKKKKPCELPDVVWLGGLTEGTPVVQVNTQCDAWMPYDLNGISQKEIYEINAPRIEAALIEIQRNLNFSFVQDQGITEYAVCNGFKIDNITNSNGKIQKTYFG